MKVRIPQEHYDFYRQVYQYLHHSMGVEIEHYPDWDFARRLIGNYLDKHRQNNHLTHLLENDQEKQEPTIPTNTKDIPKSDKSPEAYPSPPPPSHVRISDNPKLSELHQEIAQCQNCFLGDLRKQYVKLPPSPIHPIMIVVDIPSFYDQTQGAYFMDEAGSLLKKILKSIELNLSEIYYTAAVKCSTSQEIMNHLGDILPCRKHFINEIHIIKPQLILGFGKTTYDLLMLDEVEIKNQEFIDSQSFAEHAGQILSFHGIDIVFTHHPRDLLIDPSLKKMTWEHLKKWISRIGEIKNGKQSS